MGINLKALRAKHEELEKKNSQGGDFVNNFLTLENGTTLIRILPPKEDDEREFYAETRIHRIPQEDGTDRNVHCRKVHGEACPLCDAYFGLWKQFNAGGKVEEVLSAAARQIKPRDRFYMNVVDRKSGDVKILSVGIKVMNMITSVILDEDFGDITDLETGHDYKIHKVMEGKWPKYDQSGARPKPTPAGKKKEIDSWMSELHDIYKLVRLEDYEEVKNHALSMFPQLEVAITEKSSEDEGEDKASFEKKLEV